MTKVFIYKVYKVDDPNMQSIKWTASSQEDMKSHQVQTWMGP